MKLIIDIDKYSYDEIKKYYESHEIVKATYSFIYHGTRFDSIIEGIKTAIKYSTINVEHTLEGYNDDDIDGIIEDVIGQVKGQVIKIIDKYISGEEKE